MVDGDEATCGLNSSNADQLPDTQSSLRHITLGHIPIGDLFYKVWVWIVHHDMEVLYCVDRLEVCPVFEPNELEVSVRI